MNYPRHKVLLFILSYMILHIKANARYKVQSRENQKMIMGFVHLARKHHPPQKTLFKV